MKIRKVLSSMVAVLALGATSFVTTIPVAEAAGNPYCPLGASCVWTGNDYYGVRGENYDNSSPVHSSIHNRGNSAAANGASCWATQFYDFRGGNSGSYFILYSKSMRGENYQDPYLANGAGVGPYANQDWANRISRITYICGN
ncbi:hypothetical protein [Arcanobacterium pinnipediorum]|uniref:Peptidase inhibitor family I36 n=1 Tax=Arcanobacterium pinnipediorum TaxID=1503041 RepID=A0ABY5AJ68_9ACTO|nr:hypothetical protein [Arcanobacterium pinnipediorum]USR79978.1 hypothetical protein NG665_03090 [Arcanobacterium pinnipediorum]